MASMLTSNSLLVESSPGSEGIPLDSIPMNLVPSKRMMHLSGHEIEDAESPQGDIEIVFTGLRPGEKLFEEMLVSGDVLSTSHPIIMRSLGVHADLCNLDEILVELDRAVLYHDIVGALDVLQDTVEGLEPEYPTHQLSLK